jgi:hypothetical protein
MDAPWTDAIYPWYDGGKEDSCKLSDPIKEHEAPRQCGFDDDVCVPVQEHAQREADHIDPLWLALALSPIIYDGRSKDTRKTGIRGKSLHTCAAPECGTPDKTSPIMSDEMLMLCEDLSSMLQYLGY